MHSRGFTRGRLSSPSVHYRSRGFHHLAEDLEGIRQWLGQDHTHVDSQTCIRLLTSCGRLKALQEGKRLHALIKEKGFHPDIIMANCILNMYGKCHSVQDARDVFDQLLDRNEVSWTSMIAIYAKHGQSKDAFDVFERMQCSPSMCPNEVTLISVLIACNHPSFCKECDLVFVLVLIYENTFDLSVSNALVTAYTKCQRAKDAQEVFRRMPIKNVVSWTAMIRAFSVDDNGKAVHLFRQMLVEGVLANSVTYKTLLYECSDSRSVQEVKILHVVILETGGILNTDLESALVAAYGECGTVEDTQRAFSLLQTRDLSVWNSMLLVLMRHGLKTQAFQHFEKMQQEDIEPNSTSIITILSQCASLHGLMEGRIIHICSAQLGIDSNEVIGCALIEMYGKCGHLMDARTLFKKLDKQNEQLWSLLIVLCTKAGHTEDALALFCQMQVEGILPNHIIFSSLLSGLEDSHIMIYGRMFHLQVREMLPKICDAIGSSLVSMYSRCGDLEASRKVFGTLGSQNSLVMWNALLVAYSQHGQQEKSLEHFTLMLLNGITPNCISFSSSLTVCADLGLCKQGELLYGYAVECKVEMDIMVKSAMINMYGKCKRLEDALWMQKNMGVQGLIAWNSIIGAFALHGHFHEVIIFYEQMKAQNIEPSGVTFTTMLKGCSNLEEVWNIHHLTVQSKLESVPLLCNALINTYGDFGALQSALNVFNRSPEKNVVTWNTMMGLHARGLHFSKLFQFFCEIHHENMKVNEVSLTHALSFCSSLALLEEGKLIYAYVTDLGVHTEHGLQSALVNFFGTCGQVRDALHVFNDMQQYDVISCTTMVVTYLQFGQVTGAVSIFQFMQKQRIDPSDVTFVSVLSTCSHAGLVEAGCLFFVSMVKSFNITPSLMHLCCLLDMLSRSGQLDRAEYLVHGLPVQPVSEMWITLISACRVDCDLEQGKQLAGYLFQLSKSYDAVYLKLSSMYYFDGLPDSSVTVSESDLDAINNEQEVQNCLLRGMEVTG